MTGSRPAGLLAQAEADREALEHIARAVRGRMLKRSGEAAGALRPDTLTVNGAALKILVDAIPAGAAILAGGEFVHANAAFAQAVGYRSQAELEGAGGLDTILSEIQRSFRSSAGPGGKQRLAVDIAARSGARLRLHLEVVPLDPDGRFELASLVELPAEAPSGALRSQPSSDSRRDQPTESGRQAQKFDFLAKISHELRTPLNSILGFAELMLEGRFGPIGNGRYKAYLEDIHQSGLYALSLLNDLLDISKIEAGKFELDFTAVDLAELVEACVGSLQPLARRERILMRTSFDPKLPAVIADRRRLKQILLNLLSNAIKFTNAGGQVIVSAQLVEGASLRIRVRDNGVGMTDDEIALAMQPFRQLDTAPRHQIGTGLGLPLARALAEANRARLLIHSEKGAGTSVDVVFPPERLALL